MPQFIYLKTGVCALILACGSSSSADVITEWNSELLQTFADLGGAAAPTMNSRVLAMTSAAVYDAVNSVNRTHQPHLSYHNTSGPVDLNVAAAQAAYTVMDTIYGASPALSTRYTNLLNTHLAGATSTAERDNGISLGLAAAQAILADRASDGSSAPTTYTPEPVGTPGAWQPSVTTDAWGTTVGEFLDSEWGYVTPFGIESGDQFRPVAPPALTSSTWANSLNNVQDIGDINSTSRTADQTNIAYFWVDGPGTVSPPGHWNQIAQGLSSSAGLSLEDNARLFAMLNVSQADAGIATWDSRRAHNLWRPIDAIQQASIDGNPLTIEDPNWQPLLPTPSFPTYNSGHSAFSAAGAATLANYFGSDAIPFTTTSDSPFLTSSNNTRSYNSLSEAAEEAGMSRIYGGIHYDFDNDEGQELGKGVADYIFQNRFLPVPEPSGALLLGLAVMLQLSVRRRKQR